MKTQNQNQNQSKPRNHITRARNIASSLGVRVAAGYLRDRGWSIEAALWILTGGGGGNRSNEFNYSQILNT